MPKANLKKNPKKLVHFDEFQVYILHDFLQKSLNKDNALTQVKVLVAWSDVLCIIQNTLNLFQYSNNQTRVIVPSQLSSFAFLNPSAVSIKPLCLKLTFCHKLTRAQKYEIKTCLTQKYKKVLPKKMIHVTYSSANRFHKKLEYQHYTLKKL